VIDLSCTTSVLDEAKNRNKSGISVLTCAQNRMSETVSEECLSEMGLQPVIANLPGMPLVRNVVFACVIALQFFVFFYSRNILTHNILTHNTIKKYQLRLNFLFSVRGEK
jgi:hypothetical protein